jgi:GH15 family glucan-1,4-alpha-glucosidase
METFVQYYGSDALDASVPLMPLVFFLAPTDRRMLQTLDAINRSPERGGLVANGLVYRYNLGQTSDGLSGEEGAFNICTFWMVEAMTRAGTVERIGWKKLACCSNARSRQSPRIVRRGDGRPRRGVGEFPAGVHAPVADQRGL